MHALNLSCEKAVQVAKVRYAKDMVRECTTFCSHSAKRKIFLKRIIAQKASKISKTCLVTLCTTRFTERREAIVTFWH